LLVTSTRTKAADVAANEKTSGNVASGVPSNSVAVKLPRIVEVAKVATSDASKVKFEHLDPNSLYSKVAIDSIDWVPPRSNTIDTGIATDAKATNVVRKFASVGLFVMQESKSVTPDT